MGGERNRKARIMKIILLSLLFFNSFSHSAVNLIICVSVHLSNLFIC
jgi:hypothetical protein